jgi:hypothetical protein
VGVLQKRLNNKTGFYLTRECYAFPFANLIGLKHEKFSEKL